KEKYKILKLEGNKNEDLELIKIEIIGSKITKGALFKKLDSRTNVTYSLYKEGQQIAMFYYFITMVNSRNEAYIRYINFEETKITKHGAVDSNNNISLKKELIREYYMKSNKITEYWKNQK
ncbi:39358_t:CDS:2, partial [Gigaspora margarita]